MNFTCTVQSLGCNSSCVSGSLNVISNAITCSSTKSTSHDNSTSCTACNFSSTTGSIVNSVQLANNHVCAYTSTLTHAYSHVQYISLLSKFSFSSQLIHKKSFIVSVIFSINHELASVHSSSRFFVSSHVEITVPVLTSTSTGSTRSATSQVLGSTSSKLLSPVELSTSEATSGPSTSVSGTTSSTTGSCIGTSSPLTAYANGLNTCDNNITIKLNTHTVFFISFLSKNLKGISSF